MRWFKCPSLSSPEIIEAENAIGLDGVMQCLKVIEEALLYDAADIDAKMVANWASVRVDRATRLLPYVHKIYQLTTGYLPDKSKLSTTYLPDNAPSNPVGTGGLIRENRIEREELPPQAPQGGSASDGFDEFWEAYPVGARKEPKLCREIWKTKKLGLKLNEILAGIDNLKKNCDLWRTGYIVQTPRFLRREKWNDEPTKPKSAYAAATNPATAKQSKFERLKAFTVLENIHTQARYCLEREWLLLPNAYCGLPGIKKRDGTGQSVSIDELREALPP